MQRGEEDLRENYMALNGGLGGKSAAFLLGGRLGPLAYILDCRSGRNPHLPVRLRMNAYTCTIMSVVPIVTLSRAKSND